MSYGLFNELPFGGEPFYATTAAVRATARTALNQGPGNGTDYPFLVGHALGEVLSDFFLSYDDDAGLYEPPFRVVWLYGADGAASEHPFGVVGPATHDRDVLVADAAGAVVFDSTVGDYSAQEWGTARQVVEWRSGFRVCRAVVLLAGYSDSGAPAESAYQDGWLDPQTYTRIPPSLRAVRVGTSVLRGNVVLSSGYNVALAGSTPAGTDGGPFGASVAVDGVAGAGLGRKEGCGDAAPVIRRINKIGPDAAGRFTLSGDDCFRIRPPVTASGLVGPHRTAVLGEEAYPDVTPGSALVVASDCGPCCPCDYFVRTYRGLKRVWADWQAVGDGASAVRDAYASARERWLAQLACRTASPLKLAVAAEPGCRFSAAAAFCNASDCCLTDVEVRVTALAFAGGDLVAGDPGGDEAGLGVAYSWVGSSDAVTSNHYIPRGWARTVEIPVPVFSFTRPAVAARQTATLQLRACLKCSAATTAAVTVSVHAADPGGCPPAAPVSVPDDVAQVWATAGLPATPVRALLTQAVAMNPERARYGCGCS